MQRTVTRPRPPGPRLPHPLSHTPLYRRNTDALWVGPLPYACPSPCFPYLPGVCAQVGQPFGPSHK